MIELLVIVVVLGVLAGVILPRVSAGNNRRGEVEAEAARTILTRLAEKDAFSPAPLALVYSVAPGAASSSNSRAPATYRLTMETKRTGDEEQDVWTKALLVQPVVFASLQLHGAATDAGFLPNGAWRIEFGTGQPRQRISLCLSAAAAGGNTSGWQVDLLPGELFARKALLADVRSWSPSASGSVQAGGSVDLDAQGQRTATW